MTFVCAAMMGAVLIFSGDAAQAALRAAQCFVQGVMPTLMPMAVLGRLMPQGTNAPMLKTAMFAFCAGSPAAAQRAAAAGACLRPKQRECLLCLCGVMSPVFFTGTLAGWLQSPGAGWKLLLAHWLGALIASALWWLLMPADETVSWPAQASAPKPVTLPEAIAQSAQTLLCICGAMTVFSVAACLVNKAAGWLFPAFQNGRAAAVLWAVLEIGGGSSAVCAAWEKPHAVLSALCGFGGLSILLQNMLFLEGRIRPCRLMLMRVLHAACSCAAACLMPF